MEANCDMVFNSKNLSEKFCKEKGQIEWISKLSKHKITAIVWTHWFSLSIGYELALRTLKGTGKEIVN